MTTIELELVDADGTPVEGAAVVAELQEPDGEIHVRLRAEDVGKGRYRSDVVELPLRGATGTWRVSGSAHWRDGPGIKVESEFQVVTSISERYLNRYGFWIEYPRKYGLGTGFYDLQNSGGLHFEDWVFEDGSGYVILDNYRYEMAGVTFAAIEVHWLYEDFPVGEGSTISMAEDVAGRGLHHQADDAGLDIQSVERTTFHGLPAWRVIGEGVEEHVAWAAAGYPVEWLIFQCSGSDFVWIMLLSSDNVGHLHQLRALQDTFECPTDSCEPHSGCPRHPGTLP